MIQSGHIRGAVILVSHDRHLVELTVDRLWLVADSTAREFDGSLDDYRRQILSGSNDQKTDTEPTAEGNRKEARRAAAKARERTSALRKEVKKAEELIDKLSRERSEIADIERRLERAEAAWLEAQHKLDAAENSMPLHKAWYGLRMRLRYALQATLFNRITGSPKRPALEPDGTGASALRAETTAAEFQLAMPRFDGRCPAHAAAHRICATISGLNSWPCVEAAALEASHNTSSATSLASRRFGKSSGDMPANAM